MRPKKAFKGPRLGQKLLYGTKESYTILPDKGSFCFTKGRLLKAKKNESVCQTFVGDRLMRGIATAVSPGALNVATAELMLQTYV